MGGGGGGGGAYNFDTKEMEGERGRQDGSGRFALRTNMRDARLTQGVSAHLASSVVYRRREDPYAATSRRSENWIPKITSITVLRLRFRLRLKQVFKQPSRYGNTVIGMLQYQEYESLCHCVPVRTLHTKHNIHFMSHLLPTFISDPDRKLKLK